MAKISEEDKNEKSACESSFNYLLMIIVNNATLLRGIRTGELMKNSMTWV